MKNKSDHKNIKKKVAYVVLYIMIVVITIPVAITLLFQSPAVQTITAKIATSALSKSIGQKVNISTIRISFFSGIEIVGFNVEDHHQNTLIGIGKLNAKPNFGELSLLNINFSSVILDTVIFNMGTYKGDTINNLSLLLARLITPDSNSRNVFKLYSSTVKINNSQFNLFNQNKSYDHAKNSMDYANIIIDSINIDVSDFYLINDSLNFKANSISAHEQCGIIIRKMSTDIVISSKGIYTNNTILNFNNSTIDADFGLEYSSYSTFSYYIDSVNMIANIRPTTIDMADIGYFAETLFEMPNIIGITGKLSGTVSDLIGQNLMVKFGDNTRLSGDLRFTGLPDFYKTDITANKLYITTNTKDINNFYLPIEEKHFDFSEIIPFNEQITAKGNFNGYFKDFTSKLELSLSYGKINSIVKFNQTSDNQTDFNVSVKSNSFNIGSYLKQTSALGNISFNLKLSGEGNSTKNINYELSGTLTNVDLLGYQYSRMSIDAKYQNDSVLGNLRIGDKNLMMSAYVTADLKSKPVFTLKSNIVSANLDKLNLWHEQKINLSSNLNAEVTGTDINTLNANILLTQCNLVFDEDAYIIDSLNLLKSRDSIGVSSLILKSDMANASIVGEYDISTLTQSVFDVINDYFNILPSGDTTGIFNNKYANIDVNILKPKILSEQFLSNIKLSKNTNLKSKFNFTNNNIQLDLFLNSIKFKDARLDSCSLSVVSISDSLICEFAINDIILKDSTPGDTVVFGLDDFSLSANFHNDSLIYGINWNNRLTALKNSGIIEGYLSHTIDSTKFSIGKANVFINDIDWSIDSNNLVVMSDDRVFFQNLFINAGQSEFKLIGTIPKHDNDSLVASFTNWDLSTFDLLTHPMNIDLDGSINGTLNFSLIKDNPTLVSDISIKDLSLNNEYLGDAHLLNTWDNTNNSVFIKSQIIRKGNIGSGEVFLADGYYYPFKKEDNLDIDVSFNRIKLKIIEPFVSSFIKDLEGTTSGKLEIRGSAKQPIVTGSADMQRTTMRVVYLNTKYSFTNSIEFIKNGINFDNLVIYDTLGNEADINGNLTHTYFSKPKFDIVISTPGLLFFNTTETMNDLYYGSAIASGEIKIFGSPKDIDLSINIKTKKGTSVTLPLNYSVEISDKDYIIFTKPAIDSLANLKAIELEDEINTTSALDFNMDVNMAVTPDAKVSISLPEDMGTIEARGNSNLSIDVNSNGKFSLIGDYVVESGLFHFKIGNLVSKRFTLVRGGRISWTGSPYSARVDIKGLYKVKTNLMSLGIAIDTTASYKNKVTVECYVVLTNELLNPTIKFEIRMPELDPDLQRLVFSELDTTNTAMMNQQMISLLVLGTFSFNNAANVSLQSSYYNVIANQLSGMLSQISDNVDVGLNYKPGDDVSAQEFEVALSTQLFDDRLSIDGNFGMTYDRSEQSASNLVGDVDIRYKLTPDGQWILKVFNHSNVSSWYNYSNYDQQSPYTQGVGIAFVRNFNKLSELFQSRKKDKKKENNSNNETTKEIKKGEDETSDQ
ncbi:MAG: translocation/assembly module TamB domain-containing protein [Bacteroidota bacterium]